MGMLDRLKARTARFFEPGIVKWETDVPGQYGNNVSNWHTSTKVSVVDSFIIVRYINTTNRILDLQIADSKTAFAVSKALGAAASELAKHELKALQ